MGILFQEHLPQLQDVGVTHGQTTTTVPKEDLSVPQGDQNDIRFN